MAFVYLILNASVQCPALESMSMITIPVKGKRPQSGRERREEREEGTWLERAASRTSLEGVIVNLCSEKSGSEHSSAGLKRNMAFLCVFLLHGVGYLTNGESFFTHAGGWAKGEPSACPGAHLSRQEKEACALWLIPQPGKKPDSAAFESLFLGAILAR